MPEHLQQTPDLFWLIVEWVVKAAGAALMVILSLGWKEYRTNLNKIAKLETSVAVLENEVRNLKQRQGHADT